MNPIRSNGRKQNQFSPAVLAGRFCAILLSVLLLLIGSGIIYADTDTENPQESQSESESQTEQTVEVTTEHSETTEAETTTDSATAETTKEIAVTTEAPKITTPVTTQTPGTTAPKPPVQTTSGGSVIVDSQSQGAAQDIPTANDTTTAPTEPSQSVSDSLSPDTENGEETTERVPVAPSEDTTVDRNDDIDRDPATETEPSSLTEAIAQQFGSGKSLRTVLTVFFLLLAGAGVVTLLLLLYRNISVKLRH